MASSSLRCNIYPDRTNSKESTEWILHMGVMGPAAAPLCRRLTVSSSSTWPARRLAARTARSPSPNLCRRKFSPFPVHCLSTAASSSETPTDHCCTYVRTCTCEISTNGARRHHSHAAEQSCAVRTLSFYLNQTLPAFWYH